MTSTSSFGVSRREGHDASEFYARFSPPALSQDASIAPCSAADKLICGDAQDMTEVEDNSVALVVTSPPYHAGKAYESEVGVGHVPATYLDYLQMLHDVFAECYRVLEPGGRIAVNVANLGRKPYRSLSADVVRILQDDLGFLLRGEVIWQKGAGATGSCAWGSFAKATNPVLRDLSERIIVACKGRFDRAIPPKERALLGHPHESTISREEFMEYTLDVWQMPTESAKRVGHPAPYPVELPRRLIELYTYKGDVVLDPFMGSGSTALAAVGTDRRYVGYDIDPAYIDLAEHRIADAQAALDAEADAEALDDVAVVRPKAATAKKSSGAARSGAGPSRPAKSTAKSATGRSSATTSKAAATKPSVRTTKATAKTSAKAGARAKVSSPAAKGRAAGRRSA